MRQHHRENVMRRILGIAAIAAALLVSACDTVEGMHRDGTSPGHHAPRSGHRSR
jgi:predicted small secreted protein